MKGQHRLMKIVEIEDNYQKHRQRLLSIQHINARKKQNVGSLRPTEANINYKQSKLRADIFSFKTKNEQIQHENQILLSKIEKQYDKGNYSKNKLDLSRSQSSRSVRSAHSTKSIQNQNVRIYQKINNTKSIYSNIRQQRSGVKLNTTKQQIFHLLVNQLGVKPSVLLPILPRKIQPSRSSHNRTLDLNDKTFKHYTDNIEMIRKKHSLTNPNLPKK